MMDVGEVMVDGGPERVLRRVSLGEEEEVVDDNEVEGRRERKVRDG